MLCPHRARKCCIIEGWRVLRAVCWVGSWIKLTQHATRNPQHAIRSGRRPRMTHPHVHLTPDLPATADLVVIGGGIVGAATAFFAARAGLRTVVLEKRPALCSLTTPAAT